MENLNKELIYLQQLADKDGVICESDFDEFSNNDKKDYISAVEKCAKNITFKENTVIFEVDDNLKFTFQFSKKIKDRPALEKAYKQLEAISVDFGKKEWFYKELFEKNKDLLKDYGDDCFEGDIFDGVKKEDKIKLLEKLEEEALEVDTDGDKDGCAVIFLYPGARVVVFSKHDYGYFYEKDGFCKRAETIQFNFY